MPAREQADISWVLRKRQRFIILLILINILHKKLEEKKNVYFRKYIRRSMHDDNYTIKETRRDTSTILHTYVQRKKRSNILHK